MEVVLVADGCSDDTVNFAKTYPARWSLRVLELPGLGPGAARNHGAEKAQGEILIFLDDDMEVTPEFVASHVSVQIAHLRTVAVGMMKSPHPPRNYFEHGLQGWWNRKFFDIRQPGHRFCYDDLFAGNFSLRSSFFLQAGGFNRALHVRDDYELGIRLMEAGAICRLVHEAVAIHHDVTILNRSLQRRVIEGQADVFLNRRYPGLRTQLVKASEVNSFLYTMVRRVALQQSLIVTWFAKTLQHVLPVLEALWMFRFWLMLFYFLQEYWYWRGVGIATREDPLPDLHLKSSSPEPAAIIDLASGIEVAERHLDETRPASARLFIGNQWISDIPYEIGYERLRGEHLRRILATKLNREFRVALALHQLGLGETHTTSDKALRQRWEPPTDSPHSRSWDLLLDGPKKILDLDLVDGLPDVDISGYCGLFALIRSRGRPLDCVATDAKKTFLSSIDLYAIVSMQLGSTAVAMAWGATPPESLELPPISIVVCTRNRTNQLSECLQALLGLNYPQFEILVVDNAPADEQTAKLTSELPVRYIREERPGLDWARNRGITEAQYQIIAFTDDDTIPDRNWLRAIAHPFQDARVMVVTGSVLPKRLDTQAQNLFEFGYGGMNHGFIRRTVRRSAISRIQLLWASAFGVGANMAFRKIVFENIGNFDTALDVGTPSAGGGDLEMFHRLVAAGHILVYEPDALVWHSHRPEMTDLERLAQNNGRSFGCYLLTCARNRTVGRGTLLYFALRHWLWGWIGKRLFFVHPGGFPRHLVWQEFISALGSPLAYQRSRAYARRVKAQFV